MHTITCAISIRLRATWYLTRLSSLRALPKATRSLKYSTKYKKGTREGITTHNAVQFMVMKFLRLTFIFKLLILLAIVKITTNAKGNNSIARSDHDNEDSSVAMTMKGQTVPMPTVQQSIIVDSCIQTMSLSFLFNFGQLNSYQYNSYNRCTRWRSSPRQYSISIYRVALLRCVRRSNQLWYGY